jgi:hypothetical protein
MSGSAGDRGERQQTLSSGAFDTGDDQPPAAPPTEDPPKLKAAKLNIEHNATDHDTGFRASDSEGWQRLEVIGPGGEKVLRFEAHGELGELGMTELFFETVEPENADVPSPRCWPSCLRATTRFRSVHAKRRERRAKLGTAWLTHTIPAGPELLTPAKGASVPVDQLTVSWNR